MKYWLALAFITIVALVIGVPAWAGGGAVPALPMAGESSAAMHNAEGIDHYNQSHWKIAHGHFKEAVEANSDAAEAHYNLALALDKMGQHGSAAKHFKHAHDLGKDNPDIQNSGILKAHLKMLK